MLRVSGLWIYPIKSCRGIAVDTLTLDDRGPVGDRRWMLVDAHNQFLTIRQLPRLALVSVAQTGDGLQISAPGFPAIDIDVPLLVHDEQCVVWHDTVTLFPAAPHVNEWFSAFLGFEARLMYMPQSSERVVDPDYSPTRRLVTLADAFPMLLIGEGSLRLLNEKLLARGEAAIPVARFRPNVIVAGTRPHEEDGWRDIRIGELACSVVKPCARCAVPTVDIETGIKGKEPTRTLAGYRAREGKIYFGQNVIHAETGSIRLGDEVALTGGR